MKSKLTASKRAVLALMMVSMISLHSAAERALAQPSEEAMQKARQLGLLNMKKGELPAYLKMQNIHISQSAPSNFPVDAYRSNVVSTTFMNSTAGAPTATLSIVTKDSPSAVNSFYQSALRSRSFALSTPKAELLAKLGPSGTVFMMHGARANERISVNIAGRQDGNTYISVSWMIVR